jgi:hypothetical protein
MTTRDDCCTLSKYELLRQKQILENEKFLNNLHINDVIDKISTSSNKRKRLNNSAIKSKEQIRRKSSRINNSNTQVVLLSTTSCNNKSNMYCKYNISSQDLKLFIGQNYSDKRMNQRVRNIITYFDSGFLLLCTLSIGY